jgi:hypothetical protein
MSWKWSSRIVGRAVAIVNGSPVNNYSEIIVPSPTTIYIDDAVISTACIAVASTARP